MGPSPDPLTSAANTHERWQQIGELFDRAVGLDAPAREALFAQSKLDAAVEAQLRRMLAANDRASILDEPPVPGVLQRVLTAPRALADGELLIDRFEIRRLINRGGMGEVYEAFDRELREVIALKTILSEAVADPKVVERFRREVHLARRITNPNICRIFDLARRPAPELLFLTMELLPGDTLAARLREPPRFTPAKALPIIRQVVAGLTASHEAGIIHRDLKPSNIMLGPDRVVVTDFGLARSITPSHHSLSASQSGHGAGTPAYLAPEQLENGPLTPATDVYALGIVIYEMVTGAQPFTGQTGMEIAFKRLREAPPAPRSVNPAIPWGWNDALLRALAREPADRYRSAAAFLAALEHPPRFRTPAWWRAANTQKRRRTLGLAGVALALAASAWWAAPRLLSHHPPPTARKFYQDGTTALREGSPWRASQWLEQAVQADPDFALAHARLAEAWQQVDLPDRARASILRVSALEQSQWLTARQRLEIDAIRFGLLRDPARSVAAFEGLVSQAEHPAEAWVDLGRAQELAGRSRPAEASYLAALAADRQSAAAHLHLANLLVRRGDWDVAETHFSRAQALFEGTRRAEGLAETHQGRAALRTHQKKYGEAAQELERALAVATPAQQIVLRLRLAALAHVRGRAMEADRETALALQLAHEAHLENLATRGLIQLAKELLAQGRPEEGRKALATAIELARGGGYPHLEAAAQAVLAPSKP